MSEAQAAYEKARDDYGRARVLEEAINDAAEAAWAAYDKDKTSATARAAYHKAQEAYLKAQAAYDRVQDDYDKARKAYNRGVTP